MTWQIDVENGVVSLENIIRIKFYKGHNCDFSIAGYNLLGEGVFSEVEIENLVKNAQSYITQKCLDPNSFINTNHINENPEPKLTIEEFASLLSESIRTFEKNDKPTGLLFHYRTLINKEKDDLAREQKNKERTYDIIKYNRLSFANYKILKDKNEIIFPHQEIVKLVSQKDGNKGALLWEQLLTVFSNIITNYSAYTLSLSHARDDSYLWRKYADNMTGCSFGFDFRISEDSTPAAAVNVKYLLKVIYEENIEEFKNRINSLLDLTKQHLNKMPVDQITDFVNVLITHLLVFLPLLKKDEFKDEKEYRLIIPGLIDARGKRYPAELPNHLLVGIKNNDKESHFGDEFNKECLREILIGERAEDNTEEEVINLFNIHEYDTSKINVKNLKSNKE